MRRLSPAALVVTMVVTTACGGLFSLHSLYTAQDRAFDPALEGKRETDDERLLVERNGDAYKATAQNKQPA